MTERIKKVKIPLFNFVMLVFFSAAVVSIFVTDFIIFTQFKADSRIILHNPVEGRTYPPVFKAAGFAWDRNSIEKGKDIKISIILTRISDGKSLVFEAGRSTVHNGPTNIFKLSAFSSSINLPGTENTGEWTAVARMTNDSGLSIKTAPRHIKIDPKAENSEFRYFSPPHISALIVIALCSMAIFLLFRNNGGKHLKPYFSFSLAFILFANEIIYHWYWYGLGAWNTAGTLLFHMCGLAILIIPFALFTANENIRQYLAELIYFWGLGGAVQALLTPEIGVHGFPEIRYFFFFISHGFIILTSVYIILLFNIKIGLHSLIRSFIISNIVIGFIFVVNNLLRFLPPYDIGNYFFVSYPPPGGSLIDLFVRIFGPSPRYLIGIEIMGTAVFGLLCLPFIIFKKRLTKSKKGND